MFQKPFKVKSHSLMRNSDKRKLRTRVESELGDVGGCLDELIGGKVDVYAVRAALHTGENVQFFCANGDPIFFESLPESRLLPSVYALWKCPLLVSVWLTWPPVVSKLCNGADLMLPGVVLPASGDADPLGQFGRGEPRAVATPENYAAVAVGVTAVGSKDLAVQKENWGDSDRLRGKGLLVRHVVRDQLWAYGSKTAIPLIPFPEVASEREVSEHAAGGVEVQMEESSASVSVDQSAESLDALHLAENDGDTETGSTEGAASAATADATAAWAEEADAADEPTLSPTEVMDQLLEESFLMALATKTTKSDLPMLTSTFYRQHVMVCCPPGKGPLDVKHSSFKKLTRFLAKMKKDGYVEVKETSKGVESLTDVNWLHPDVRAAKKKGAALQTEEEDDEAGQSGPEVTHFMSPSAELRPIFAEAGHAKDALLTNAQVRDAITAYVKKHDLISADDRSVVCLNDALSLALKEKGSLAPTRLRWDALMKAVKGKMLSRHQV